jgi:predicted nuclease of predicted toxin-antitoxin system
MKLLLDQGLPRSTVSQLSKTGIEAVHVGEIGMAGAEDAEILAFAEQPAVLTYNVSRSMLYV